MAWGAGELGEALDRVSGRRILRPTWEKGCKDAGELVTCSVLAGKMKWRGRIRNLVLAGDEPRGGGEPVVVDLAERAKAMELEMERERNRLLALEVEQERERMRVRERELRESRSGRSRS